MHSVKISHIVMSISMYILVNYVCCAVGAARIIAMYSVRVVKGDQKGQSEGSGKLLLCILLWKDKGTEVEGRVMSS